MDVAEGNVGVRQHRDEIGVRCQKLFQDFLDEYKEDGDLKYLPAARDLEESEERTMVEVSFTDVENYNQNLAQTIIEEYYRIYPYLNQALSNFVKDRTTTKKQKNCYVAFVDVPTKHAVRELKTDKIGALIRISGQVIRTHPVHPELVSGTFKCMDCQTVIKNVEQQFKYTNPTICRNPVCSNRKKFALDIDKSTFVDFQKVRIQETQSELPRGCVPRSVEVILREENVESVQAGDRYDFTGTLIVIPDVGAMSLAGARTQIATRNRRTEENEGVRGLKVLGVRELHYRMAFLACSVQPTNPKFGGNEIAFSEEMTAEQMHEMMSGPEWTSLFEMSKDKNLYQNMISSLFPSIHGNDEVKKGILLMLLGGVSKSTIEGTTLRGDINCCIVGDPSTAKSQFLKQVAEFWPRAVYTSGKASSAAGLTAAVVRDEESSEFVIEAGALMLADNGVCCIDEFDKMDPRDQVAIHEAMEQQTISIAKAGVRATLNARTSILAAANPIGGRYDRGRSLQQNIQLSAPIMSRFDLFFILVDECNEVIDYAIARKIVDLHSNIEDTVQKVYTKQQVLEYIMFAKRTKPTITQASSDLLIEYFGKLRLRDSTSSGKSTWRITVRQLESMIRLSEAMAKMDISNEVHPRHVREAYRLLNKSIIRVEQPDIHLDGEDDHSIHEDEQVNEERPETPAPNVAKKKTQLRFEEYKHLSNMIVVFMRRQETKAEQEGKEGVHRSDVLEWYLNTIEDTVDSEEELIEKKDLIEKILDRLIYVDNIIIPLTSKDLKGSSQEGTSDDDPLLVVHPNYILD